MVCTDKGTGVAQRENDRREERGIWAGHSKRIVGPTWKRFFNQRIVRCIVYRRSTLAAHSFPSLRRFLTVAPACWPQGKIPPHPSARSARHWSPQNGGPKGKMIEGRSGGSGRGTRRELWAHLTAVLQPADRTLYRVPTLDPRRPLISFPPPLPHPRTCLLVTGKIPPHPSARSARHSSPQNGRGPKGK